MKIEARHERGVTILAPRGKITAGAGSVALRNAVDDALARGAKHLILNLAAVTTIDSSGIGELLGSHASVSRRGGRLKLAGVPRELLRETRLSSSFEIYDSEAAALASF